MLLDDTKPAVAQMAECLADWYKLAQTVYLKSEILEKDVRECERNLHRIRDELYRLKADLQKDMDAKMISNNNQLSKMEQKNRLKVCLHPKFTYPLFDLKICISILVYTTARTGNHVYNGTKQSSDVEVTRIGQNANAQSKTKY